MLWYRRARYGYAFRRIRLAQPKYAKVDPEDYDRLRKYEWLATKGTKCFYARRRVPTGKKGKVKLIYMHQELIEVPEGMVIDHINHEGMDNRNANLRPATRAQNMYHRKKSSRPSRSKYKGVCWKKHIRKWTASIGVDGKRKHLGCFTDEIDAARAYDRAAKKYHAEFASLNFPD